jgi:hypothetical protein
MNKIDELTNPDSCLNRAGDNEMLFVLLARDAAAPYVIEEWCRIRITMGKNKSIGDPQILGALECARQMRQQQEEAKTPRVEDGRSTAKRS